MLFHCRFVVLSALLLLAPTAKPDGKPSAGKPFVAKCVGVSDWDTLTVLRPGPVNVKVRLEGIDAPEKGQPFGQAAKQALSTLAFGRRVQVRSTGKDRLGRLLADVFIGSDWINLKPR